VRMLDNQISPSAPPTVFRVAADHASKAARWDERAFAVSSLSSVDQSARSLR
jgi:hypothetical protein